MRIKTLDVMYSQHRLFFPLALLEALWMAGQGEGSNRCHALNAQPCLLNLKKKKTMGH